MKIGENVLKTGDQAAFIDHAKAVNLPSAIFYVGDVNPSFMAQVKEAVPNCIVAAREWPDAGVHLTEPAKTYFNRRLPQGMKGKVALYLTNEPGWSKALLDWTYDVCVLAVAAKQPVIALNMSIGTPQPNQWPDADKIIQLSIDNPTLVYIGLHEYAGGIVTSGFIGGNPDGTVGDTKTVAVHLDFTLQSMWPNADQAATMTMWHMGRYKFLTQYAKSRFGGYPSIIITESGFDFLGDIGSWLRALPNGSKISGWRTLAAYWKKLWPLKSTAQAYMDQLIWAETHIYNHPAVKATCLFARGESSDWNDWRTDPELDPMLVAYQAEINLPSVAVPPVEPPPPPPPPVVVPKPDNTVLINKIKAIQVSLADILATL